MRQGCFCFFFIFPKIFVTLLVNIILFLEYFAPVKTKLTSLFGINLFLGQRHYNLIFIFYFQKASCASKFFLVCHDRTMFMPYGIHTLVYPFNIVVFIHKFICIYALVFWYCIYTQFVLYFDHVFE